MTAPEKFLNEAGLAGRPEFIDCRDDRPLQSPAAKQLLRLNHDARFRQAGLYGFRILECPFTQALSPLFGLAAILVIEEGEK